MAYRLKPGQLITSINSLVEECGEGETQRKVRAALDLFQKYVSLTMETTETQDMDQFSPDRKQV